MTSSRDCDVIPRDQHFLNCSMAHAKRLSTTQYKPHLSTVFRLAYSSFRKCMGNTVSIYMDGWMDIYMDMGFSIYEKISKSRYLTLHISEPFWPRNLKFFLWCPVHLKIYQKNFEVFPTSGTWVTRGLKIGISAILIDLYISIASKPQ